MMKYGKPIIINEKNTERISKAFKEANGKCTSRTYEASGLRFEIESIEKQFSGCPKKSMDGLKVLVDPHAQSFPNAYKRKGTPMSTCYTLQNKNGSWRLIGVGRLVCDSRRFIVQEMPEALKRAIVAQYMTF